jgi:adenosine kinase
MRRGVSPRGAMAGPWHEPSRDLAVAGHVNVDRFLRVARFPGQDRTAPLRSQTAELGGTATNLARVATGQGLKVGLVARLGEGFPEEFRRLLRQVGIDVRGLSVVRGVSTPTCFIIEDGSGGQRTLIDQGPMAHDPRAPLPGRWLAEYAWLHVGTGDPAFQLRLARHARQLGLRVAADPAQELFYRWSGARLRRLLAESELLFGNRAEIAHAIRLTGGGTVARLLERVPLIVLTDGASGARAYSRTGRVEVDPLRPRRIRTLVGAGDAFRGGFYAAWLQGEELKASLQAGVRSATRWIEGER